MALLMMGVITQAWLLVPFLAAFELIWACLCYIFALQSLALNDIFLLFVAISVLFLSAVELVLSIAATLVLFHKQRVATL